jgi:hypothetical protein
MLKVARPLIWHDARKPWPKRISGGTCFVLRFEGGLIGITAAHVISAFDEAANEGNAVVSMVRTASINLRDAIIDQDDDLDIATFKVTEEQLVGSEAIALDCRSEWPPPTPDRHREVSLAGYPEILKKPWSEVGGEFAAYVALSHIEDVTPNDIITTHDPQRDTRVRSAPEIPDIGANLSGCSGGPMLMHVERNRLHRWFPVGLIVAGPRAMSGVETRDYDTFRTRRLSFVNPDGSIQHQNVGWLPGRGPSPSG